MNTKATYYYFDKCYKISKETLLTYRSNTSLNSRISNSYVEAILDKSLWEINIICEYDVDTSVKSTISSLVSSAVSDWNKVPKCDLEFKIASEGSVVSGPKCTFRITKEPDFMNGLIEGVEFKDAGQPKNIILYTGHNNWGLLNNEQKKYLIMHMIGHIIGWKDVNTQPAPTEDNTIMISPSLISEENPTPWNGLSNLDIQFLQENYVLTPEVTLSYQGENKPKKGTSGAHICNVGTMYNLKVGYRDSNNTNVDISFNLTPPQDAVPHVDYEFMYEESSKTLLFQVNSMGKYQIDFAATSGALSSGNFKEYAQSSITLDVIPEPNLIPSWIGSNIPTLLNENTYRVLIDTPYCLTLSEEHGIECTIAYTLTSEGHTLFDGIIDLGEQYPIGSATPGKSTLTLTPIHDGISLKSKSLQIEYWKRPELSFEWEREPIKSFQSNVSGVEGNLLEHLTAHEFYLDVNKVYPVHINYVNENYPGEVLRLSYTTEYINPSYEKCVPNQTAAIDVDSDFPEDMEPGDTPVGGNTTISYLPTEDGIPLDYNYNIRLPIQPGLRKLNFTVKKVSDEEVVDNFHIYIYGLADGFYYAPTLFTRGGSYNCKYTYGHPDYPNATVTQAMTEPIYNHPLQVGEQWGIVPIEDYGAWIVSATVKNGEQVIQQRALALVDLPNSPQPDQMQIRMVNAQKVSSDWEDGVEYEGYVLHYLMNINTGASFAGFVGTEVETRTYAPMARRVDRAWAEGQPVLVTSTSENPVTIELPSTQVFYETIPYVQIFRYYSGRIFWPKNGVHLPDSPDVLSIPMNEAFVEVIGDNGLSNVNNRSL